jgi:energy-coupling factor transporter ATP-binding protein EcfA2
VITATAGKSSQHIKEPLQLDTLRVESLFGVFNHEIVFPHSEETSASPSLLIIHGNNGVGKTRLLSMLDGLIRLDFNPFRQIPFKNCELKFTNGDRIYVEAVPSLGVESELKVTFRENAVRLAADRPGAAKPEDTPKVDKFRSEFFQAVEGLTFEFIDAERLLRRYEEPPEHSLGRSQFLMEQELYVRRRMRNPKARVEEHVISLSDKVKRFIREAQLNYRTFFTSREPDLFPRILQHLTDRTLEPSNADDLRNRLENIRSQDAEIERFGLEADHWDFDELAGFLTKASTKKRYSAPLNALGAYVEMLESRSAERKLVAQRLLTFEKLMSEFFEGKYVNVDNKTGLNIISQSGHTLSEDQLSSGEFHLLYLMVSALVTKRRGTIVAIDEPEMSMHISWQRKLVRALVTCASGAQPQFIFATHSPDIAAEFQENMVRIPSR